MDIIRPIRLILLRENAYFSTCNYSYNVVVQAPKFEASPNSMMMIIDMISLYFTHVVHKIVLSEALQLQTRNKLTFFAIIYTNSHVVHIRPKIIRNTKSMIKLILIIRVIRQVNK